MKRVKLFRETMDESVCEYDQVVTIDFAKVVPSVSGPQSSVEKMPIAVVAQQFRLMMRQRYTRFLIKEIATVFYFHGFFLIRRL